MRRHLSATTLRRFALAEQCLRAVRRPAPIDTLSALMDGAFFVEMRPAEFARFALAVAEVRFSHVRHQRARP